jgi:hypothetical protein
VSRVRFAAICDHCAARSPEYTPWFFCRECGAEVCRACSMEHDEETGKALCGRCIAADAREYMAEQSEYHPPARTGLEFTEDQRLDDPHRRSI